MSEGDYLINLNVTSKELIIYGIILIIIISICSFFIIIKIEDKHDYEINSFFYYSFKKYLTPLFKKKQKSPFLYIYLHNEEGDYAKEEAISLLSKQITERYLLPHYLRSFHIEQQTIVIFFKNETVIQDAIDDLKEFLLNSQEGASNSSKINATLVFVDDIHLANSFEELEILLKNYRLNIDKNSVTEMIYFNEDMVNKIRNEIKVVDEIDYAIETGGVEILLQPIYDVERKKYIAAETVLRLKGINGRIVKPNEFASIAIKYNKMNVIDIDIIKQSCAFYELLRSKGIELDYISINASGFELENTDFANAIVDAINNSNISPDKICIEINDLDTVKRKSVFLINLNSLRLFGCVIAVSGFGATNSRLSNITELNAEFVKLSPLAIKRANENEKARIVLRDTASLINDYKMLPIAVGVETKEEAELLDSMNIKYLQGRYYSDAISKEAFLEFMNNNETEVAQ